MWVGIAASLSRSPLKFSLRSPLRSLRLGVSILPITPASRVRLFRGIFFESAEEE